jgi:hypothetical protein
MKGLGDSNLNYAVGNQIPLSSSYGFIKRIVMIQMPATLDEIQLTQETDLNKNETTIRIDFSDLYARPSPYRIDPLNEALNITLIGFNTLTNKPNITEVKICTYPLVGTPGCVPEDAYEEYPRLNVTVDGNPYTPPQLVNQNVTLVIDEGYFHRVGFDRFDAVDVKVTFDQNVTNQSLFSYNYSTIERQPWLEPAVVEVRVW